MIKNIAFDFGGVVVGSNRDNAVAAFRSIGVEKADEYLSKYVQKGIFLQVENGEISADEFCQELGRLCGKSISFADAQKGWLGYVSAVSQEKLDFLTALRTRFNVFILSNTNPFMMDWARSERFSKAGKPLDAYVDKIYTSYEAGCVKPSPQFFNFMLHDADIRASETVFVDDGMPNIEAARALGFHAFHVKSYDWEADFRTFLDGLMA